MNPLIPGDWVTLAPGEKLTLPNGWMYLNPPEGAVEMRLTYDTMSPAGRPFGDGSGDASTFAALPEGVWTSPWAPVRVPER